MKTIDGKTLKLMLISAANNLYNHYPEIDALNVFPVPDGDTGMNMNLTLASGAKEVQNRNDEDVFAIATTFSKGLLMGARGNSGVITSQIFRGFSKALENKKTITLNLLAEAFQNGSAVAYKAVMRPVEGTILTVVRESSQALAKKIGEFSTIEEAMAYLVKEAKASLKRTPDLLPVLKEVGVVDSGGAGFVKIVEGMNFALKGKIVERKEVAAVSESKPASPIAEMDDDDEFGYCTEFIMRLGPAGEKQEFIESSFKTTLLSRGNSIVIVRDDDIVKVHIHTLNPGGILQYAQTFGEFVTIKVENMTEQHSNLQTPPSMRKQSVEEAPSDEPLKEYGIVAISAGAGLDEMFKEIGVTAIVSGGQTMNPSIEDISKAIRHCHAKTVFVLPNNSNIIMAAMQAADLLADEIKVNVIATKTIPQGIAAASVFNIESSAEENLKTMNEEIKHIASGSVTYAIKNTTVDGVEVKKDEFMAITDKKIVACRKRVTHSLYKLIEYMVKEETFLVTILVGEDINDEKMNYVREKLQKKYENIEFDVRRGDQPVYSFLVGVE